VAPKARILAVDDQVYFRTHLEEILASAGYAVVTASSGPEALTLMAREGPFDVVLTDLVMPEMDGVETVERIREASPEQDVIVITTVGDVRSAVAAMRRGAADYLLKPLDPEGLLAAIESVLRQRKLRAEHARLVSENLAFMGQLSLYERATALFAATDPVAIGKKLLELCCIEARATSGALWLKETPSAQLRLVAARALDAPPDELQLPDSLLERAQTGALLEPDPEAEENLLVWIPSHREETLWAVARLHASSIAPPGSAELAACGRLAELGALALERAMRPQAPNLRPAAVRSDEFRDPATDLATLAFLAEVARIEIHKAQRFGRFMGLLCIELGPGPLPPSDLGPVIDAIRGCLRSTDILAREAGGCLWVLVAESDPLGGIVLKRRIAERIREQHAGADALEVSVGLASFPQDGSSVETLLAAARLRAQEDRRSLVREFGLDPDAPFAQLTERLLERAGPVSPGLVTAAADLVIGDLASRPGDRGLLFLAPGLERAAFLAPLAALGEVETATDVFVALEGDTLPAGPNLHALPVPPELPEGASWILRFGEAPPYVLLAGPPDARGSRAVFHAADPALVEHLVFRLRSEVGFGVRV
jgi:DNA-binding response OmpR family regulator